MNRWDDGRYPSYEFYPQTGRRLDVEKTEGERFYERKYLEKCGEVDELKGRLEAMTVRRDRLARRLR